MNVMKQYVTLRAADSYLETSKGAVFTGADILESSAERCEDGSTGSALPEVSPAPGLFAGYEPIHCLSKLDSGFLDLQSKAP